MFVGIETPDADALRGMKKDQNLMVPLLSSIATLNSYGLEVTAGMIIGLDTDTPDTDARLIDFIDESNIPILTINLLQALPKTPLWDRLARDGRLVDDPELESNVRFLRPHDDVVASWRRCASPTPTRPSGCSRATATRSTPPIRIASIRRCAAGSTSPTCASA